MLDRRFIRQEPDRVCKAIADKHENCELDAWLALDSEYLELLQKVEELKTSRNPTRCHRQGAVVGGLAIRPGQSGIEVIVRSSRFRVKTLRIKCD